MNDLFTDKYLPKDIKSYTGFNHQSVLQYVEKVLSGREMEKKAIIFHGLPGTGKTTLARMLPDHFGISYHYTNASDKRRKKDVNVDIFRTTSLRSKNSLIIFDEVDGLSKTAFKEFERVLKTYNQPVILIANNLEKIPYPIRKICAVEKFTVDRFSMMALAGKVVKAENLDLSRDDIKKIVDRSKSFRAVLHALQFGIGSRPPEQLSLDTRVLYSLQGQDTELSGDLSDLIIRMNDNSSSPSMIALADLWNRRYVSGYTYGKYIVREILSSIRNPGIKKLNYPRTYALIHQAKTGKKMKAEATSEKRSKPKIRITGFKS